MSAKIEALDIHSGHDDHAGRVWIGDEHYSPDEAREIARFLVQVADDADDDGATVGLTCVTCGEDIADDDGIWRHESTGETFCDGDEYSTDLARQAAPA